MRQSRTPDLAGIPVFHERWSLGGTTFFDDELDADVRASLESRRQLEGYCNLHAVRATFRVESTNLREDVRASDCGSCNRNRAMVAAISWALFGDVFSSLAQTCAYLNGSGKRVYVAATSGAIQSALSEALGPDRLVCSEYFGPQYAAGELVGGRRNENLEALSFEDESFDLIVTEDVMEHVADAVAAEREIGRVLRRGGVYCFSIPFHFNLEHDRIRALMRGDGTIEHLEEPQYHGDPIRAEGVLVFRDYAANDLSARFGSLGCTFEIVRVWSKTLGIVGPAMVVMVVRRVG